MKLAIQIVSWIIAVICGLMLLASLMDSDSELMVGSILFGILPIMNIVYLKGKE